MKSIKQVLEKFDIQTDKYISREFQSFALHLAEALDDSKHTYLYIKLAKTRHRSILEKALSFAIDSPAKNKGALFMWKLKQLQPNPADLFKTAKVKITGEVQKVGFRQFLFKESKKRGLSGQAKNMKDGSLIAYFYGDKKLIDEIIKLSRTGPPMAEVNEVTVTWIKKKFTEFEIL